MSALLAESGEAKVGRRLRAEASAEVIEMVHTIRLLLHGGATSSLVRTLTGARMDMIQTQAEYEGIQFLDRGGRRYRDIAAVLGAVDCHLAGSYFLASYKAYCALYQSRADWGAGVVRIDDSDGQGTLVRGAFARALYATRQVMAVEKFSALQARMLALSWGEGVVDLVKCSVCPTQYAQLKPGTQSLAPVLGNCPVCRAKSAIDQGIQPARVVAAAAAKQAWSHVRPYTL